METIKLTQTCWHVDILRAHVENLCIECHDADCYVCGQAALMGFAR